MPAAAASSSPLDQSSARPCCDAGAPPSGPSLLCPYSRGVTLGYAELKKLIIETVDKVPDGADKVITGGRLNVTAAMLALDAMLNERGAPPAGGQPTLNPAEGETGGQETAVVSPPSDSPVPPPLPSPLPSPAPPGKVCGGSPLAGLNSASQSSTSGTSKANFAIDGDCIKRRVTQGSCAQTRERPAASLLCLESLSSSTGRGRLDCMLGHLLSGILASGCLSNPHFWLPSASHPPSPPPLLSLWPCSV